MTLVGIVVVLFVAVAWSGIPPPTARAMSLCGHRLFVYDDGFVIFVIHHQSFRLMPNGSAARVPAVYVRGRFLTRVQQLSHHPTPAACRRPETASSVDDFRTHDFGVSFHVFSCLLKRVG